MPDWNHVAAVARSLAADQFPDAGPVWDIVLQRGERMLADGPAQYARYYGTKASYTHTNGLFLGSAAFMAVGYGLTAIGNANARSRAQAEAAAQWREVQPCRLIVTDRRLLTYLASGQTRRFEWELIGRLNPDIPHEGLVLDFERFEPLMLTGPAVPYAALAAIWGVYGARGLAQHPQVQSLLNFGVGGQRPGPSLPGGPQGSAIEPKDNK